MSFEVKSEILSAIGKTEDKNLKMILLLLLGVLEEIGSKIDNVLTDEKSLRESVLNGHADTHHADHEWVKERRRINGEIDSLIVRAAPLMVWGEARMREENERSKDARALILDIITKAAWVVVGGLGYAVLLGLPQVLK